MRNSENKRQLIRLLLSEWRSSCKYATRLHGRTVYFVEEEDISYSNSNPVGLLDFKCSNLKLLTTILSCIFIIEGSIIIGMRLLMLSLMSLLSTDV